MPPDHALFLGLLEDGKGVLRGQRQVLHQRVPIIWRCTVRQSSSVALTPPLLITTMQCVPLAQCELLFKGVRRLEISSGLMIKSCPPGPCRLIKTRASRMAMPHPVRISSSRWIRSSAELFSAECSALWLNHHTLSVCIWIVSPP